MYKLDNITKQPIKIDMNDRTQVAEWAEWMEDIDNTCLARHEIGNLIVSTVFLGVDHNIGYDSGPILFETMIFDTRKPLKYGGFKDVYMNRYLTYLQAVKHHEFIIAKLEGALSDTGYLELEVGVNE